MIIIGLVNHGNKLGREIGYPTANVNINFKINKSYYGIYLVKCRLFSDDKWFWGICNIGIRPTIGDINKPISETYIFDFNKNIYDKEIIICTVKKIREEKKFNTLDELIQYIQLDETIAKNLIKYNKLKKIL